jgi:hypothetical protein
MMIYHLSECETSEKKGMTERVLYYYYHREWQNERVKILRGLLSVLCARRCVWEEKAIDWKRRRRSLLHGDIERKHKLACVYGKRRTDSPPCVAISLSNGGKKQKKRGLRSTSFHKKEKTSVITAV